MIDCYDAGDHIYRIGQECARNGKAGGVSFFSGLLLFFTMVLMMGSWQKWHFDLNQDQDWPWVVQAYHT